MEKQKQYRQAFELACEQIRSLDPSVVAARSGAHWEESPNPKRLTLTFLGDPYTVSFPEIDIRSSRKQTVSLVTRITLLHYLIRADGSAEKGESIPYKEIPGGLMYAGVFERRVTAPLISTFGKTPGKFLAAGLAMGGEPVAFGDASFTLRALPRVPISFVFWEGDEEFPPAIQVLFDRSVDRYLSLEDVVVLGEMTSKRLIAALSAPFR